MFPRRLHAERLSRESASTGIVSTKMHAVMLMFDCGKRIEQIVHTKSNINVWLDCYKMKIHTQEQLLI